MDVDFKEALIHGSVTIHAKDVGKTFELDAKEMKVTKVSVDGEPIPFVHEKDQVRISQLQESKEIAFVVEYEKKVSDKSTTGVFEAKYGGEYFIATDFEPDRAKEFFPCKDNPSLKAVFNLRVVTDSDIRVISNSPISRIEDTTVPTRKRFVFEPTPRMSTYLFFMGAGRFTETKSSTKEGETEIIVASRSGTSDRTEFILETASEVLRESGKYFGVPFPLKKLHLIALPEFGGAMENWGAITSYEGGLLIGKSASTFSRKAGAITQAHEIQHQWFGDLVTMKWWDDVWLNESFATFMSYKMMDRLRPSWNCWGDFLGNIGFESMRADQLRATHPIQAKLNRPSEITEVFDQISYGKGASVIRMIEAFLGEEAFRKGINGYIRKFSYGNASSEDLWNSLKDSSGQPVDRIMGAWVTKSGFPLVTASRRGKKLIFEQRRFTLEGEAEDSQPWPIPITVNINGKQVKFLFEEMTRELAADESDLTQLKVNAGQTGYYCVRYSDDIYELIASRFAFLDGIDKAGIMNDLFQLLKAGLVDPKVYFRFVGLCGTVEDYTTALTVFRQLRLLNSIANTSSAVTDASLGFLNAQLGRLSLSRREGEAEIDSQLRGYFVYQLAKLDIGFAKRFVERFDEYESLDPNLKPGAAAAYILTTGEKAGHRLLGKIVGTEDETEREYLYLGISAASDPSFIQKMIKLSASGEVSRSDLFYTLAYSARNPIARKTTWTWVKENYDRIWECLGQMAFVLSALRETVPQVAVESEADAREFFSGERLAKGELGHRQNLELVSVYARLRRMLEHPVAT